MPDEEKDDPHPPNPSSTSQEDSSSTSAPTAPSSTPPGNNNDRQDLVNKARAFLASPQVRNEDIPAKRRFLAEKGLTSVEIDLLIQELPQQVPSIPPRTYPQPPPSNLPNLLVGVLRILTWVAGSSAAIIFVYLRYLLPRLTSSFQARRALQNHQRDLFEKLYGSLNLLKSTQKEVFATLPQPQLPVLRENPQYEACATLEQLKSKFDVEKDIISPFTLLRCAFAPGSENLTVERLFETIEAHFPHLNLAQELQLQETLWQVLSTVPLFHEDTSQSDQHPTWSYNPPEPTRPTQYLTSLTNLKAALPFSTPSPRPPRFQYALEALTDLTGYLTAESYPLLYGAGGYRPSMGVYGTSVLANPQQEDIRKEIRALKGLVLNRRTFTLPKPPSAPQLQPQSSGLS